MGCAIYTGSAHHNVIKHVLWRRRLLSESFVCESVRSVFDSHTESVPYSINLTVDLSVAGDTDAYYASYVLTPRLMRLPAFFDETHHNLKAFHD